MSTSRSAVPRNTKRSDLKRRRTSGAGDISGTFEPATPLTKDQAQRKKFIENNRPIHPSRWIDLQTINELEIAESVQILTSRLGLWEFLCDEVQTYKKITIEFLSSFEYDRSSRIMTFNLGGYGWRLTAVQLMNLLEFPTANSTEMADRTSYQQDMPLPMFKSLIITQGDLNYQRSKTIVHPTLRYIQRVLANTIFGRGETASVIRADELFYLHCMLRRNEEEMHFMPHLGHFMARHFNYVAKQAQPNGYISCGGVITKLARALHVQTGTDIVEGPTTLDLAGLTIMQLIRRHHYNYWVTCGPDDVEYKLPLQHPLDPANSDTWKPVDEPDNAPESPPQHAPPPPPQPEPQQPPPFQAGPNYQDMMNYMIGLSTNVNNLTNSMNDMRIHFDNRFNQVDRRFDDMEREVSQARHYAQQSYYHFYPQTEEVPETPPAERRRGRQREQEEAQEPQDEEMEVNAEDGEDNDP